MSTEHELPSMSYISDAAVNNAETLFSGESPCITSLIDLIGIVQAAVLNEWIVTSPLALDRSSLLQELGFADTFRVHERTEGDEAVLDIRSPKGFAKEGTPVVIDVDGNGDLCADSAVGELFLASAWSEMLQTDEALGSLVVPERLADGTLRGSTYLMKFAAFMLWLMADRNLAKFENEEARQHLTQRADTHLQRYHLLSRRLIACRDRFGLDLMCSVIEAPLFSLSVAQEVNRPFEYLEKFDETVRAAIAATRGAALQNWHFPTIGAAVLARAKNLGDLPNEIEKARGKLLKARSKIRSLNLELLKFEREMDLGNDQHFKELDKLKVTLQRALQAFGEKTEYQSELESFPLTERVWWMPKLLTSALAAIESPIRALAEMVGSSWLRRQSYLRYVPGLTSAASYVNSTRRPMMKHLIENVLQMPWDRADIQSRAVGWAMDLTERCAASRSAEEIENKVLLTLRDESGEESPVREDVFWSLVNIDDRMRALFLLGGEA